VDDGTHVEPSSLAEIAGLAAVVARHRDDQVVAVDDDLGPGHAESVHAVADDLLGLHERVPGGRRPVRGARRQRDTGPALQVDAELGLGLLVPREEDEQIGTDQEDQEECQVAVRVHRR
jgi:hypothetical protein